MTHEEKLKLARDARAEVDATERVLATAKRIKIDVRDAAQAIEDAAFKAYGDAVDEYARVMKIEVQS